MFRRSRWLLVFLAILVIGTVELVSDSVLDPIIPFPGDTLLVMAVIAGVGLAGVTVAFRSIDRLAAELRERNAELEASNATTRALHRVSLALATLSDLDAILDTVVASARDLLDADVALLVLARSDGTITLAAASGPEDAFDRDGSLPGADFRRFVQDDLILTHLAAAVRRGGRSIGTLAVGSRSERSYAVDAVETLASLAGQAAIAIERDRLQRELRELAIRAERERIAREMHDGLAQVLGYVNTKSLAVAELLAAGSIDGARTQLAELSAAARSVYVDIREAILGLSSPIAPDHDLVGALEGYGVRFSAASKLVTTVAADDAARGLRLAPASEAQIFRIVQEALTNIRKHAAAKRAMVSVALRPDELV
ncbi:MAG TPA: histidine kinase, partial [Candidatus Saccharimonadia bacterium]|nr:histidine kinase [Candidatus Saccharimonadia bacterium]